MDVTAGSQGVLGPGVMKSGGSSLHLQVGLPGVWMDCTWGKKCRGE